MGKFCLLVLVFCLAAPAQKGKPNFSGTWELVIEKSDFGSLPPPKKVINVIEHKEPMLTMKSHLSLPQGDYTSDFKYRTSGAEDVNESYSSVMKTRAQWVKQELVIEGDIETRAQVVHYTERWQLLDGGKTLVNNRTVKAGKEDIVQKLVYVKK